jgi:hypothetical protein
MDDNNQPCTLHPNDAHVREANALLHFREECTFQIHCGNDPTSAKEAMAGPEAEQYFAAMGVEMSALECLDCWQVRDAADVPDGEKVFRGKFVLKKKPAANGMPEKYKARYVISDPKFLQRMTDVDCFSPMSRSETIRYLLSKLGERNWALIHTDIMNAFPTATLDKPVWMQVPDFLHQRAAREAEAEPDPVKAQQIRDRYKGKMCQVTKALYGLGNAPRQFNKHLDQWFKKNGYVPSSADSCLYMKYDSTGQPICAVATFVDDAIVAGTDEGIADYRQRIVRDFGVRDYGTPTDFVGMEIDYDRSKRTCTIRQAKYIAKMAQRYGVEPTQRHKPVPMNYTVRLLPTGEKDARCDATLYRSITGALHFAAHSTRPDIANAVRELSKHLVDPSVAHYEEARKVLTYLLDTADVGITYGNTGTRGPSGHLYPPGALVAFSDASYAECMVTRKSTSGHVVMLNGGAISWSSHTQKQVSLSSADAEYKACSDTARECLFLRKLNHNFTDMPASTRMAAATAWYDFSHSADLAAMPNDSASPTVIFEDNEATIKWVQNPVHHARTKHIDVCYHFVRDEAAPDRNNIVVKYIDTTNQLADVLTKQLAPSQHWYLIRYIMNFQLSDVQACSREGSRTSQKAEGG